jgi:N-acetylmuramoyl-L-alanine amidase
MKKMATLLFFCGIICSILSYNKIPAQLTQSAAQPTQKSTLHTIVLDAGHGGIDPGAIGLNSHEADIALEVVMKLGPAIEKEFPGIKVVYTRTSDALPGNTDDIHQSLRARADIANKAKGDLFISIHCNANNQPAGGFYAKRVIGHKKKTEYVGKKKRKKIVTVPIYESYWVKNMTTGTATYIWAADRGGAKGGVINNRDTDQGTEGTEGAEGGEVVKDSTDQLDLTSPEAKIRAQLYEKKYFANSFELASLVEDQFSKAGRNSTGVKQRNNKGIWVLQATAMPSILIETGFITNKEEEEYLNSDKGQNEMVRNIIDALKAYKEHLKESSGGQ